MKNLVLSAAVFLMSVSLVSAQKLDKFGADMGKKSVMGKDIRIPYTSISNYFGFVKPGVAPDETKGGKKYYYVYIWVPAAAPEIGLRMISPVPEGTKTTDKDFVSAEYTANSADTKSFFDTWISFERAEGVMSAADIAKGKTAKWNSLGQNDDSGEMPAQPSGSKYNSLMRITSEVSNPMKALVVGLYRIGFTTYKTGEVQGSFMAQIGAPVDLPGVVIAPNLDALAKQTKK
jgi:hypothetical protein